MRKPLLMLSALTLGLGSGMSSIRAEPAAPTPPAGSVPLPFVRPADPIVIPMPQAVPQPEIVPQPPTEDPLQKGGRGQQLRGPLTDGLDALTEDRIGDAIAIRNRLPQDSLDRKVLTFAIATSGARGVPSGEIAAAQKLLKGWPGLKSLRALSERAFLRDNPPPAHILAAFGNSRPETVEGALILARGLKGSGRAQEAEREIRRLWLGEPLEKWSEDVILAEFGAFLTPADHKARMDYLMYRERVAQARRFSELGKALGLYRAWAAVIGNAKNAAALLANLPPEVKGDPAVLFAEVQLSRKQRKYAEAAALMEKARQAPAGIAEARAWWNERRIVARGLADEGDFARAYRISAGHSLKNRNAGEGTDLADAEFHAGWYALTALKDAARAKVHFARLLEVSLRPITASRALYWLGRASEKATEKSDTAEARDFFRRAAGHPGTFYGQLAAARIGSGKLDIKPPQPDAEAHERLEAREPVRAIARLEAADHGRRARVLYRALAEALESPGELALLAARAEGNGDHALSLEIGKIGFARGVEAAALAFPLGVIPEGAQISASGKALAYAIARQESGFNPGAVSPANARGLLQLLPATAEAVARRHGVAYQPGLLTADAGYNATLGAHYLGEQITRFSGSYILTFIAYNAGPRRVSEWIARYGDPRGKPVEAIVDWIERIPFPETRAYVQRVMENYQVYKTLLGEAADIEADLRFGRR